MGINVVVNQSSVCFQGILVHVDNLPAPSQFGSVQTCDANVPWTNEKFYYAIAAVDERGNRGQISNLVSVYIHEVTTTTVTSTTDKTIDPLIILKYLKNKNLSEGLDEESFLRNISENLEELERSNSEIYIAVGIVCGVVIMIIILLVTVMMISRKRKSSGHRTNSVPTSTASNTSQVCETEFS